MQLRLRLPQLEALACDRCGGAVELTALSDHFKCGHCGHQQALAGDVRARLEAYHAAVRDQLPTVVRALDDADLFVFRHAAETKLNIVVAAFGVGVLALWCVAPVGMYFSDTHAMTDLFGASCFVVPMLGLPLVALVRFLTRDSTRVVKRYRVQLSDVQARCSGCGGDAVMPGGIAFTTCSYCRAPLVATASKIAGVLDEVRGFRRAAGLRKRATERDTLGPRANAPLAYRGNAKWYADTTAAVYARPTWAPTRAWLHAVAARVGAAPLEGDEVVGWLDAQWPGADPATSSAWSHPLGAVAFDEAGLPARIDV